MASRPDHKAFIPSRLVSLISRDRIGLDRSRRQQCYMCQESAHFLNHCPVLLELHPGREGYQKCAEHGHA